MSNSKRRPRAASPPSWVDSAQLAQLLTSKKVREAWASLLDDFEWDFFATLTFGHVATITGADAHFRRWIRRLEQRAQGVICWFLAIEVSPAGQVHIHSLVGNTNGLRARELSDAWRLGRTTVEPFDSRRGGAYYVTKSITEPRTYYDISRRLKQKRLSAA